MSVTKNAFVNVLVGVLIVCALLMLCKPCFFTENDSASVMSYICMPTNHAEITALLEENNPDFSINGQVVIPCVMFILGVVSLALMIIKRNMTVSLVCPIVFSILGSIGVWCNELTRFGGVSVILTILMLAVLVLAVYNGSWFDSDDSEWKPDPKAKAKLKAIEKAVSKKKLEILKAYADSRDLSVRTATVSGMGKVGGPEAFQPLIRQLNCSEPEVRIAAAKALGELGDLRGRTYLLHFMESDHDSRVRTAMKQALGRLPSHTD